MMRRLMVLTVVTLVMVVVMIHIPFCAPVVGGRQLRVIQDVRNVLHLGRRRPPSRLIQ